MNNALPHTRSSPNDGLLCYFQGLPCIALSGLLGRRSRLDCEPVSALYDENVHPLEATDIRKADKSSNCRGNIDLLYLETDFFGTELQLFEITFVGSV